MKHSMALSFLAARLGQRHDPRTAELLESQRMANLEQLKERADLVILDTPPTLVVTDAVILSGQVDGCIVVLQQGRVATRASRRSAACWSRDAASSAPSSTR